MRPKAGEVDVELQRRQRIADAIRDRERPVLPAQDVTLDALLDRAGSIVDDFVQALVVLSRSNNDDAMPGLRAAAARVDQLLLDSAQSLPRPWLRIGRLLHQLIDQQARAAFGLLDAFGAGNISQAEVIQSGVQSHLDEATAKLSEFTSAHDVLRSLISNDEATFVQLLARKLATSTDPTIMRADELGRAIASEIIGPDEAPVEGVGLGVLWSASLAEVFFDYDRFRYIAGHLYRLVRASNDFSSLSKHPDWQARHRRSFTAIADASERIETMLAAARHDRSAAREMLLYVQDIFEGACKHLAATILAVFGPKTYEDLIKQRTAGLIHQVDDQSTLKDLAEGLLGPLRNASAHLDFELRGDFIALSPGVDEIVLPFDKFCDEFLRFTESAFALWLSFEVALIQSGISIIPNDLSVFSLDQLLSLMAASIGLGNITVNSEAERIEITGTGTITSPMPTVGALLAIVPETVDTVSLTWRTDEQDRHMVIPANLARIYSSQDDDLSKQLAFLVLCSRTTLDGLPYLTREGLRQNIARRVGEVSDDEYSAKLRRLRLLATVALDAGDTECERVLRLVMRAVRLDALNEPADAYTNAAVVTMAGWLDLPTRNLFVE